MKANDKETDFRVLKAGTCPSLSGKSKLKYEFGCDHDNRLHLHIASNTGTGYFSRDWVPLDQIALVLKKNGSNPITCHTLGPIFHGRSVNTPGFLLAALKGEGLVQNMADKARCYEALDPSGLITELQGLIGAPAGGAKKAPLKVAKGSAKGRAPKA